MYSSDTHRTGLLFRRNLVGLLALGLLFLALGTIGASAAQADGTLTVTKGGDRNVSSNDFSGGTNYANPLAGAQFEYTSDDPTSGSATWHTIAGTTAANGQVSVSLPAGIYFVREKSAAPGFTNFGALTTLNFGGSSQPYVARVQVENNRTTYAYPQENGDSDPDNWTPTNNGSNSNDGSPFLDVRDNGTVPSTCGQNILLVLDRSGSIGPYKSTYETAAKEFVNQLNGTPTQIGIISFNDSVNSYSPSQGSSSYYHSPLDLSNSGSMTTLNNTISSIYNNPENSTNWDGALQAASKAKGFTANGTTGQTTNPDLVVFITDGNPTISEIDNSGGNSTSLSDLSAGIASANLVKTQPSRGNNKVKMLAIGVGDGVTKNNLKVVSGPVEGVDGDYAVPTIPQLESFLQELAASQCGARVYVRKRIAGDNTNQAGWKYTAVDPRPGHTPTYLDGDNSTHPNGVPPVTQTGAFFTSLPTTPTTVQVNENATGQPVTGFSLTDVTCRTGSYDNGTVVNGTKNGLNYSLTVNRGDAVYCTYTNALKTTLSIVKTPKNQTINAGDDAEFTLVVKNTGTNTATSALVSDQLPAPGATPWVVSQQPAGGNCTINGSNLLGCTLGDLAAGASRTIKVKTTTDKDSCGAYNNPTAKASASNADEVTDSGSINCQKPSLTIDKSATNSPINAGEDAKFSITMSNGGPGVAKNAKISDPLPGGVAAPGWSIDTPPSAGTCAITAGTLNCSFGDLASGQSRTVTLKAPTSAQACATYNNTATGTADNSATKTDSATVACQTAGLGVVKTAVNATISAGDNAQFTIVTSNTGAGTAKGVTLSDPLPTGVSGAWTITNQPAGNPCSITGNTLNCNFGDLTAGATRSVTVSAPTNFQNCTTLNNTASASSTNAPGDSDSATINCQKPNLSVDKTTPSPTINAGDDVKFTVKTSNAGPGTAKGVTLADPLPSGTAGAWSIESQPAGNPCSISAGTLNCTFGDLAAGQDRTVTVKAPTDKTSCTVYNNTATAHSTNAPDASDGASTSCQKPSLTIDKTATNSPINAGQDAKFSITLTNNGPGVAKNAKIADPLPSGVAAPGWSIDTPPSAGTCSITAGTLNCTFGDLASGQSRTVTLKAPTSTQACTSYDNTATGTADNSADKTDSATVNCQKPGLTVDKSTPSATINAGDPVKFTIKVANNGLGTATAVTLNDPLPGGVAAPGWSIESQPAGNPCSITAGNLSCNFGDLAAGQDRTVTVTAPTSFDNCTAYNNTATAHSTNAPDASDGASTSCQKPSLTIDKTATNSPINAGEDAKFSITLTNNGPGVAKNAKISDPLPSGTLGNWSIDPANPDCQISAGVLNCSFGDLASGQSRTVSIKAATGTDACTTYNNTATGKADNSPDKTDSASVTCQKADLGVLKTAVNGTISAGDNAQFTIVTSNTGAGTAKAVKLSDPLPTGVSGAWTITNQPAGNPCSITGNTLNCDFGDLASGASRSVTVSAPTNFQSCTTLDNTATATSTNAPDASDGATINCQKPNLTVDKTTPSPTINAGDDVKFTVKVSNGGPGVAKAVTLADPLPAGIAGTWSIDTPPSAGTCAINSGTLNCSFGDLAAGQDRTVTVKASTDKTSCTVYDNTATAHSTNAPDASDGASTTCQKPSLVIDKTATNTPINAGEDAKFSITLTNNGPGVAKNAKISDPLPSGTQGNWSVDTPPSAGTCSVTGGTLDCSFGDLAAGQSRTVTVKAATSDQACGTYDNTATGTADNSPDRTDSATVVCQKAGLGVLKTAVNGTISAGDNAQFTIVTSNTGAGTAKAVMMNDPLPTGVSGAWTITDQPAGNPCSITGNTLNCDFGDLASGASRSVTVSAPTDFESCTTLDNTATAKSTNAPDASDDATINCQKPNLTVEKTTPSPTINAGDDVKFTVKTSNAGPGTAKGVTLSDPLPAGVAGAWTITDQPSGDPAPCSIVGGTLNCAFGDMAAETDLSVTVKASTDTTSCTIYDNTATAKSTNAPDASDEASVSCQKPNLATLKTAVNGTISAGDNAQFTIKVTNNGPGVSKGTTLNDPLPTGVSGSWTITSQPAGNPAPCSITAGSLICNFGDLAAQSSREVKISAPTNFEACSTLDNTATAGGSNAANASGSDSIECQRPNLSVVKTGNGTVNAGEDVEFTLAVTNGGPGVARNVTLSDSVPSGVAGAWTISSQPESGPCSISGGILNCDFGDMNAEETLDVTISAPTDGEHCATYDNTATAKAGNAPDASDSAIVNCVKPVVEITKQGSGRTGIGQEFSFTIKVSNTGQGIAHGVTVNDPLSDIAGNWEIGSQTEGANCEILNGNLDVSPAGSEAGTRLVCQVGELGPGKSITVTIQGRMNNSVCATVDNTATVGSENAPDASADAKVGCVQPHLQLRKKANLKVAIPGQKVRYTVLVRNTKLHSVATDLKVCDRIPPHMTVTNRGEGHFSNGRLCWNIQRLEGSKKWTRFHYVGRVANNATAGQRLKNVVTLRHLEAHWTVRVKTPPVRARRKHHTPVTG